jgi:hypothetical protein
MIANFFSREFVDKLSRELADSFYPDYYSPLSFLGIINNQMAAN